MQAPAPTTIEVIPASVLLALPSDSMRLTAVVRDQNGNSMQGVAVQWSSADGSVATVDPHGLVVARDRGSTQVFATIDSLRASAAIGTTDQSQVVALIRFYQATGGPRWEVSTNWVTTRRLSTWHGVEADHLGRITAIHLRSNNLAGEIPPDIAEFSQLRRLDLGGNDLVGAVPPPLGTLRHLYSLRLQDNAFTGPIPAELGGATALRLADFSNNRLEGLLPARLTNLRPRAFLYGGNSLCTPLDAEFLRWLAGVERVRTSFCPPTIHERLVLAEVYHAMGGTGWTRQDGWLTDQPVGQWAGVSVNEAGWVEALDLSDNGVTGELASHLGHLRLLAHLDVSDNEGIDGVIPEWMTELNVKTLHFGGTGVCAPPEQGIADWLGAMNEWSGEVCTGADSILVSVPLVYLTQPVQDREAGVPIVAGRDALLRVFAVADAPNYFDSEARATFYRDGAVVHVASMTLGGLRGLPIEVDEGRLETSHHAWIPGEVLVPGLEMVVELDPGGELPLRDGSRVRVPASGTHELDVREVPVMKLTVVPIQIAGADTSLAAAASRLTPRSPAFRLMKTLLPIADIDFRVRETLYTSTTGSLLSQLYLLQQADGDSTYYLGIVPTGGAAVVGGTVALSDTTARTIAHEIGHNFSLLHAPCGDPDDIDPVYPHPGGRSGGWGIDPDSNDPVSPNTPEVMSYCGPPDWISGYNFRRAMAYRIDEEAGAADRRAANHRTVPTLLLWGSTGPGEVALHPAIVLDAAPSPPRRGGPYRIEGRGPGDNTLFSLNFTPMIEAESGEGQFVFNLPADPAWAGALTSITLSGPHGSDRLDATVRRPMAVVRDRATGRIRKLLQDFETVPVAGPGEVVTVSYGLPDAEALRGSR